MNTIPTLKKFIPWQNRKDLGGARAFFMTMFEALVSPIDYFEKLQVSDDFQDPMMLSFYNSFYLAGPLIPQMLFWVPFVTVIFIIAAVPVLLFAVTLLIRRILLLLGETTSFKETFYVLAFSTPAFILAYVPKVGYWLAIVVYTILVGVGLATVHKLNFTKIFLGLIFAPLVIMIPFGAVRHAQEWQVENPRIDIEWEAQKVLAVIAVAAENYALKHEGRYPAESGSLLNGPEKFIVIDYCGKTLYHYQINCDFRGFGYYVEAKPWGWQARGKKYFYATTGGKIRSERKKFSF